MNESNPVGRCRRCGAPVHFKDEKCPECGAKNDCWVTPDRTRCGNCHAPLAEGGTHVCEKCGYTWTTCLMIDREQYCPKCGGHAPSDDAFQ